MQSKCLHQQRNRCFLTFIHVLEVLVELLLPGLPVLLPLDDVASVLDVMGDGHLLQSALRVLQTLPGLLDLDTQKPASRPWSAGGVRCVCLRAGLTPPGARRVWDEAWNTLGGSSPIFEYVMTEEEEYEWLLGSDGMFSWKKHHKNISETVNASLTGTLNSVEQWNYWLTVKDTLLVYLWCGLLR